jgi:secreted trypsin-like serine protease
MCGTGPTVYTNLAYYRDWIYQVMRTGKVSPRTTTVQANAPRTATRSLHWAGSV